MDAHGDKAPVREATIQKAILRWLRTRPQSFTVKLAAGPYSVPGLPDVLHLEGGSAYFFEVKAPGGRATPLQVATLEQLALAGAVVAIVRDVAEVKDIMEGRQNAPRI